MENSEKLDWYPNTPPPCWPGFDVLKIGGVLGIWIATPESLQIDKEGALSGLLDKQAEEIIRKTTIRSVQYNLEYAGEATRWSYRHGWVLGCGNV